jgi:hypothetical protein
MLFIQILIVLFAMFAFTRVAVRRRRHLIGWTEFLGWACFWVAAATLVLMPRITQWFAKLLGVGRGADAVFYVSIVVLFYLNYRLEAKLRGLNQQITQLVRKLAIERGTKNNEPSQ